MLVLSVMMAHEPPKPLRWKSKRILQWFNHSGTGSSVKRQEMIGIGARRHVAEGRIEEPVFTTLKKTMT
jgi:hypothetical protein